MESNISKKRDWETAFTLWGLAPGKTEKTKCENAENAIRKAIKASDTLKERTIEIFPQGSYRNRTNVRADSDVDICVLCKDVFFYDVGGAEGLKHEDVGEASDYKYPQFKNDVEAALRSYFGDDSVERGNKAFDVRENTYRVDADVVACFEHRRYGRLSNGDYIHLSGTQLLPDKGGIIINWPQQNYDNGVKKNSETTRHFKAFVRILKCLRNEMDESGRTEAAPIPSYLLECLAWNVPNYYFGNKTYTTDVRDSLVYLINKTQNVDDCKEWGEINELKYLFRKAQPWTREQTNTFLSAAWDYIGFE